jgi:hypothetical protein
MYPILQFAVTHGPPLASWLLANRSELGQVYDRLSYRVNLALSDPTAFIDRIGTALVSQQSGQTEVIGLLHQHSSNLEGIKTAVDGIGLSVTGLGRSVGMLTSLSMISLGFTALSYIHITSQFAALTERLKRLEAEVQEIKEMMYADLRGELNAGLIKLKNALDPQTTTPESANDLLQKASDNLTDTSSKYVERLNTRIGSGNPQTSWLLARHLTVSVLGEVATHTLDFNSLN